MRSNEIESILIALNMFAIDIFKYPLGNPTLTAKAKLLESTNKIKYNAAYSKWEKV